MRACGGSQYQAVVPSATFDFKRVQVTMAGVRVSADTFPDTFIKLSGMTGGGSPADKCGQAER
jgi:hypothetical protein